jgi:hypothetical protein
VLSVGGSTMHHRGPSLAEESSMVRSGHVVFGRMEGVRFGAPAPEVVALEAGRLAAQRVFLMVSGTLARTTLREPARDKPLTAAIALRRQIEAVAAERRAMPPDAGRGRVYGSELATIGTPRLILVDGSRWSGWCGSSGVGGSRVFRVVQTPRTRRACPSNKRVVEPNAAIVAGGNHSIGWSVKLLKCAAKRDADGFAADRRSAG